MTKKAQFPEEEQWKSLARDKKASRDAKIPLDWTLKAGQVPDDQLNVIDIPYECGILTAKEEGITDLTAKVLIESILSHKYTSYEVRVEMSEVIPPSEQTLILLKVTLAFCKRAAIAQQLVRSSTTSSFIDGGIYNLTTNR